MRTMKVHGSCNRRLVYQRRSRVAPQIGRWGMTKWSVGSLGKIQKFVLRDNFVKGLYSVASIATSP